MSHSRSHFSHPMTAKMLEVRRRPLRKIVGTEIVDGSLRELLECGHLGEWIALLNTGMFAPKSADSRRCRECAKGSGGKS